MLQNGGQKPWVYFASYKTLQGPKADTVLFTFDSCCKEAPPIDWAVSHFICSSRKQFSDYQIRKAIVPEVEAQHWLVEDSFSAPNSSLRHSSFGSKVAHLLQNGNSHFKHVYFVYEKHEVPAAILPTHSAHVQN